METSKQVFEPKNVTLQALQDFGSIAPSDAQRLVQAIESRESIVISGDAGAGKTTLMQALVNERAIRFPGDRVLIVEGAAELSLPSNGITRSITGSSGSLGDQIRCAMRRDPDTIVLGEIMESSASELLDAWLSGTRGGYATIHAKDANSAIKRFADLVGQPTAEIRIKHAVKWVVHMTERRVTTVQLVQTDIDGFNGVRWVAPGSGMSFEGERIPGPARHSLNSEGIHSMLDLDLAQYCIGALQREKTLESASWCDRATVFLAAMLPVLAWPERELQREGAERAFNLQALIDRVNSRSGSVNDVAWNSVRDYLARFPGLAKHAQSGQIYSRYGAEMAEAKQHFRFITLQIEAIIKRRAAN